MPHLWPTGSSYGVAPSITARYFSSCPSDSTSRWTPCPPVVLRQITNVGPSPWLYPPFPAPCPLRVLPIHFLRPARHYPRFWIWFPSSGNQRDFNPPDLSAVQRTLRVVPPLCLASVLSFLWGLHLNFSLAIETTGSHVPLKSLYPDHATFMPGAAQTVDRYPLCLSRDQE